MTWTYDPTYLNTDDAAGRVNVVRYLIGDTDKSEKQVENEEITFQLSSTSNDVYRAGSACCKALMAKYSRLVDTTQDDGMLRVSYSQLQSHYKSLSGQLDRLSKEFGTSTIGSPVATGISITANDALDDDTDRPADRFKRNQFRNPGQSDEVSEQ